MHKIYISWFCIVELSQVIYNTGYVGLECEKHWFRYDLDNSVGMDGHSLERMS